MFQNFLASLPNKQHFTIGSKIARALQIWQMQQLGRGYAASLLGELIANSITLAASRSWNSMC